MLSLVRTLDRVLLVVLAVAFAVVGAWAQLAPRSFYDDFPGLGRHWVHGDGPFNEHLVRDVGGLNLALVVFAVAALVTRSTVMARVAAGAALVYSLPHALYHSAHLDMFDETVDKVGMTVSLWGTVVMAAVVLVGPIGRRASAT
jgi:disulfide bond formation protein DsbB